MAVPREASRARGARDVVRCGRSVAGLRRRDPDAGRRRPRPVRRAGQSARDLPPITDADYERLVGRLAFWGYDTGKLRKVPQRREAGR